MTEVVPLAGRRARRQAEGRYPVPEPVNGHGAYSPDSSGQGWHPDANAFAPPSSGHASSPGPAGQAAPSGYGPADGYVPSNGYAPDSGNGYVPTNGHGYVPTNGHAQGNGHAPVNGHAPGNGYVPTNGHPQVNGYAPAAGAAGTLTAPPPGSALPPPAVEVVHDPRVPPVRAFGGGSGHGGHGGGHGGHGGRDGGGDGDGMRGRHATEWGQGFERVIGWTLLGSLVPGVGLIAAGRRALGWSIVAFWVLLGLAAAAVVVLTDPVAFVAHNLLAHPERLTYLAGVLVLLAALWGAHVVASHLQLRRFATLTGFQSALSWSLVTVLVSGGLVTAVLRAQELKLGQETIDSVFAEGGGIEGSTKAGPDLTKTDPWAKVPRVNILLIGSDAGADRTGVRTDTLIVASIDTRTGSLVTISLPRNLEHVPFPAGSQQAIDYPDGFYCAQDACMINALWQFGEEHKNQYYKGVKNPGLQATVQGVQEALGLKIDNYAMVNLRGFMQFVDAIGGLQLNVKRRIPVGGHHDASGREVGVTSYIEPGRQQLNGYLSLWFARSRSDSDDFERMRRQRCVIAALTKQAEPQKLALNITGILTAAKQNIRTSIPVSDIDAWVTLAMKVKGGRQTSLPLTNSVISPGDPDFERIHTLVSDALTKPAPTASAKPSASASASPGATPKKKKPTKSPTVRETGDAVDVNAVC